MFGKYKPILVGVGIISIVVSVFGSNPPKKQIYQNANTPPVSLNTETSNKAEEREKRNISYFIRQCLNEIDTNYRLGNNNFLDGSNATKTYSHNTFGYVEDITLGNQIYVAKGYFDKMIESIKQLPNINNEDPFEIKNLLSTRV